MSKNRFDIKKGRWINNGLFIYLLKGYYTFDKAGKRKLAK